MRNWLFFVLFVVASAPAVAAEGDIEALYNRSCISCHASGAAGAPKTGDVAAWQARLEKGMDALVVSADKGFGGMMPKGMCFDCTPEQFRALIEYMAAPKK